MHERVGLSSEGNLKGQCGLTAGGENWDSSVAPIAPAAGGSGRFASTMGSSSRLPNSGTSPYASRQAQLLPTGLLTDASSPYTDSHVVGSKSIQLPTEGLIHHQRCSSESFLLEQPSWVDDLLNEPETQVHKGHRRSASDSYAYLGLEAETFNSKWENNSGILIDGPSWGSHNLVHLTDPGHASFDKRQSSSNKENNKASEPTPKESEGFSSIATRKADQEDSGSQNQAGLIGMRNSTQIKPFMCKAEAKRAKQQSAHRSRVRKLQYIAELESSVQLLQAVGSDVSAELEFLDQHNLILGMENRALMQRLDSLSQENLIKQLEQEMLEREIARLQTLYNLQLQEQQQQQQHSKNRGNKGRDLDAQFSNLSI